jgi:hypothetical protein
MNIETGATRIRSTRATWAPKLQRPLSPFDQAVQDILDAAMGSEAEDPEVQNKQIAQEESQG